MKSKTTNFKKNNTTKLFKGLTIRVLETIAGLAEIVPDPLEGYHGYYQRLRSTLGNNYPSPKIDRTLYDLKKKNLIRSKRTRNGYIHNLTVTGRQKLLENKLYKQKNKLSDGNSNIVIFDIPENLAKHRKYIRRILLKAGFINLQKSVLIGPHDIPLEFFELVKELDLLSCVTVIKGSITHK
ncbi:MAG: hypothetical protein Q8P83_02560 [bacterium]|nr:hypothetical protein [bacterium]